MCAVRRTHTLVATAAGLALGLLAAGPVQAQTSVTTLAQRNLPVIPLHHHYFWTFNVDNPTNPTSGHFAAIWLNNTGNNLPETLTPPAFILSSLGRTFLSPRPGVTTGTVTSRKLGDGWTSYSFAVQVQGPFTRIWDVATQVEVEGYSSASFAVTYDLFNPNVPIDPLAAINGNYYSVLGPKAHESDINRLGFSIRNFNLVMNVGGSGTTVPLPGRPSQWRIGNAFLSSRGIATGLFIVTP